MPAMSPEVALRTKTFALRILKMVEALPKTTTGRTLGNQIARSATSVAANFRSSFRGRSKAEFISKLQVAMEESDETQFWLELIEESGCLPQKKLASLHNE
ncbi:MAG: four helix bundle protein, partial [Puniceicoccales bacterium]|nr:four helix bundle protein [Puniceicoccales bacterium]